MALHATEQPTRADLMVIEAARRLRRHGSVLVGIGEPMVAAILAQTVHAPALELIFESGAIGARPQRPPLSIGDSSLVKGAAGVASMFDLFSFLLAGGRIDAGFIGCAQIDRRGDVNSTVIGPYHRPLVRLPGSGGASDIAASVSTLIVMTAHEPRRFPERVDFVTSRARPESNGYELIVVTDLAVLRLDHGELAVGSLQHGVELREVRAGTGWDIRVAPDLARVAPPTDDELRGLAKLRAE